MQKIIVLLNFISTFSCVAFTQTFINPKLGIDYSGIEFEPINTINYNVDKDPEISFLFGTGIQQKLNNRFNLNLDLLLTTKSHNSSSIGSVPKHKFKYTSFRSALFLNWNITDQLYFGIGPTYNFISKIKISNADINDNKRSLEGAITLVYIYKNVNVGINYFHLLKQGSQAVPIFKNPKSLVFNLGYRIQIFNKKNNN